MAVGDTESMTVMFEVQVEEFPVTSVTVRVAVLVPDTLAQVKEEGATLNGSSPQVSLEPPSTSPAVMLAVPDPLRYTVISWQTALGGVVSMVTA